MSHEFFSLARLDPISIAKDVVNSWNIDVLLKNNTHELLDELLQDC